MNAASENDQQLVNILLEYKSRIDLKDNFQRNALFYAINTKNGDPSAMVSLLIENGIELNEPDVDGNTPLTLAVTKGLKLVVNILLENGADLNYRNSKDGNTALHYAVMMNNPEMLLTLLSRKPILSIRNKNEQTPIEISATCANTEIYQILAEEYNKKDSRDENILISNDKFNTGEYMTDSSLLQEDYRSNLSMNNLANNYNNNSLNQAKYNQNLNKVNPNSFLQNDNKNFPNNYNHINNINSHQHNIQININNNLNNTGDNIKNLQTMNGFSKGVKLQKMQYLQEKRSLDKSGRSIKEKVYSFPLNQNQNKLGNSTNIEIPFSFQNNIERNNKSSNGNQLHTYISNIAKYYS